MSIRSQTKKTASREVEVGSGSPVLSTTSIGTSKITPAPLHHVRSSHLEFSAPTPMPTRHSSVAQALDSDTSPAPNDLRGQLFGNTADHRASSISAISALTDADDKLQEYSRNLDQFDSSSGEEEKQVSGFPIYEDQEIREGPVIVTQGHRNWHTAPPRSPPSAKPIQPPRNANLGDPQAGPVNAAVIDYAPSIGSFSDRGVKGVRGESISSSRGHGSRHGSGSTVINGERRGSEAKSWEEVFAARRDAAAALKLVDLTNAAQDADNPSFRRYPSASTRAIKPPASITGDPSPTGSSINRYPSTSTHAMKSPDPADDLATPTTAGMSQASPMQTPSSTRAIKSPRFFQDDLATPKSGMSIATETTGGRAERGLHLPFLPRFLRLSVARSSSDTARHGINEITPVRASYDTDRKGSASSSTGRKGSGSTGSRRGQCSQSCTELNVLLVYY